MIDILVVVILIIIFTSVSSYSKAGAYTLIPVILLEYYGGRNIISPATSIGTVAGFCFVGIVLDNIRNRKEIEKNVKLTRDETIRTMFGDSTDSP
jgi:hypothetical protein